MRIRHSNGTVIASDGRIRVQREEDYLCGTDDRLYAEDDKGSALLMALVPREDTYIPCGIYSYKRTGETAQSDKWQQAKPEPINTAGKGVIDVINQIAEEASKKQDSQGNPLNADGSLKVEAVSSINELTDEDFTNPARSVQLPELPESVAQAIGTDGKPVVIKKNIFEKNRNEHKELTPEKSRDILQRALYNPNLVGTTRRAKRPDYRVVIQTGDKNAVVVLDVYDGKDNTEIVGWREIDAKGLEKMKRQAEREDGQLLILSPSNGSAAALSTLPLDAASEGKDSKESSTTQRKQPATAEKGTYDPNGDDIRFAIGGERGSMSKEERVSATQSAAEDMQGKFGIEAEVIESPDDVPNKQARKHIAAGENVKGWYDPKTGKVYLYAPNIESAQDAMATYAHEVIAHKGMEGLLGKERYAELCKRLGEALTPEQRKLVKEYAGSDSRTLGDEYIARIAETLIDEQGNIKEPTAWEKVKAVVRDFFRDAFGLELTDADIRYMLWRSGERLRRGKTDAARRAQDKATGDLLEARATIFRIVYHGTSAYFDRFDHSHMGEGEGAQSYGWGTYVTDVKEIAAGYAERVGMAPSAEDYALKPDGEYQYREGYIYEVEIPDTDKGTYLVWNTLVKEELRNRIRSAIGDRPRGNILRGSMLGEDVYRELVDLLGDPKEASLFLSKLGVIGIQYPSGFMSGNRSLENSNFVIFNEDDLEIKKVSNPTIITKRTIDNAIVEVTIETPSGTKEVVSFNGEGIRHGMARRWYPSGQLKSEDSYKYGRKDGLCRYWYVNGRIKIEGFYKMGECHGQYITYKENGDLSAQIFFENGLRHGWGRSIGYFSPSETLDYYEHGKKLVEIYYPNRLTRDHVVVTQYDNNGHATQISGAEALRYIEKLPTDGTSLRFSTRGSKSTTRNRASQSMKGQHATVVSSGAGAKIRSNLQELAKISKNFSGRTRGFIGKVAAALDMEQHEASNYKTFELDNGQLITLRVSNHNASTSLFDRNGENEGVSIVITNNANKGIKNNGVAHVIEFFYRKSDLEHSQNAPLAAIVTSIDKLLTTGEYVDTTGLAKVSEANATQSHVGSSAGAKHVTVARSAVAAMQDKFGIKAEAIESPDDVPNKQARKHIAAGENVKGWYSPKTGKVYLYAPNIESKQDVMATYAHEVIAHKGMEGLLGKERYAEMCKLLGKVLTPEQRKLVKEYEGSDSRTLGDEYIARIAETLIDENGNIKEPTTWEKVKAVVREFFRDAFGLELTDADIEYMLWRSAERLRRDGGDLFQRAQDITTGQHLRWQAETQRAMRFRFIGENGAARADQSEEATIRMDNLQVAQEMETEGKDAKNIKLATGWERGADGLWRYEENDEEIKQLIDNFFAKYEDNERKRKALYEERQRRQDEYIKASKSLRKYWREKRIKTGEYTRWGEEVILTPLEKLDKDLWNTNNELNRLVDEIRYGEVKDYLPANSLLLAEYPELGSVKFNFVSYLDEGVDGQYSKGPWPGDQGAINLRRGLSKSESYRTLTHEVQHAIQQIEGFAVGSNPKVERSFDRYNKISGEVEARNASRRMDMSDEQRRPSLAIDTEDVARNDQVVSFRRRENPLMTESEQDEALSRVNDAFNTQLRSFAPETADKAIFKLGRPSDILIAAGVVDKEMKLYGSKLLKKIREHGFALSEIKDLPLSIASPIAVFDNHRSGGNRAILTELRAVDGNILVTIEVGKGGDVDFNIVSSVFGKRGNSVVNWINKGYATYIDKEKALSYLHLSAPIAEATESQELTHATKVIQEFENPNTNRQNSDGNALFRSDPLAAIIGDDFVRASQAKAQTTVAETVNAVTADLQDKFGMEAEVIESPDDVPNKQARERIAAGENVKGWYDPKTGKVYLHAPNIESEREAMATYAHEVTAHKVMAGHTKQKKSPAACCGEVVGDFVGTRSGT